LVECIDDAPFSSDYGGDWQLLNYRNKVTGEINLVLKKGETRTMIGLEAFGLNVVGHRPIPDRVGLG
jgi:hypothetical protein